MSSRFRVVIKKKVYLVAQPAVKIRVHFPRKLSHCVVLLPSFSFRTQSLCYSERKLFVGRMLLGNWSLLLGKQYLPF